MRRRDFVAGLGGAMVRPVVAWPQRATLPVVGFVNGASNRGWKIDLIEKTNPNWIDLFPGIASP
jgi:hypothetical protein